jgi:UDPglucose 6-dehydrogenase
MIGFIGLSHLGINYALATASKGFEVVGFHPSEDSVAAFKDGVFPIQEPGLQEFFDSCCRRIFFTADAADLRECELVFVALDVLTDEQNNSQLEPLSALIDSVAPHLQAGVTLVLLSQVSPGFSRNLRKDLAATSKVGQVVYQVETLIFGRAVERALYPERYIVGVADPSQPLPHSLQRWHQSFGCPVLVMNYESAELAKIAINFFLVSSVTTTNTLAEVCENIGADWSEIVPALRLDSRIGPKAYLNPGLGIAGGNLERDLRTVQALAAEHDIQVDLVSSWQKNSQDRRDWVLRKLRVSLPLDNPSVRVAVWGLAYKENTHSVKNSPSLALLSATEQVSKRAFDPAVKSLPFSFANLELVDTALDACDGADALLVMTPWSQFANVDPVAIAQRMRGGLILDPFSILPADQCLAAGLSHHALGRSPRLPKRHHV